MTLLRWRLMFRYLVLVNRLTTKLNCPLPISRQAVLFYAAGESRHDWRRHRGQRRVSRAPAQRRPHGRAHRRESRVRKVAVKAFDEPRPYPIPRSLMTTDWQEASSTIRRSTSSSNWSAAPASPGRWFWPRSSSAKRSSRPTRRCSPRTARNCLPRRRNTARIFITRPAFAAAFPSSNRCAKVCRQPHPALYGIVNGTCNYILTRMKLKARTSPTVLADAQKLGYAETPPDLDIDGHDARTRSAFSPRSRTASG
jgi:hypothetical protein